MRLLLALALLAAGCSMHHSVRVGPAAKPCECKCDCTPAAPKLSR